MVSLQSVSMVLEDADYRGSFVPALGDGILLYYATASISLVCTRKGSNSRKQREIARGRKCPMLVGYDGSILLIVGGKLDSDGVTDSATYTYTLSAVGPLSSQRFLDHTPPGVELDLQVGVGFVFRTDASARPDWEPLGP